jgi:hypothetical protein
MELAWRIRHAGLRTRFATDAVVHHPPRRIGWRGLWRRTWMIRWMALYRLKTGHDESPAHIVARELADLLRVSLHFFTRPQPGRRRRAAFGAAWRWLTFPAVLPWMVYWDLRFRRHLSRRPTHLTSC